MKTSTIILLALGLGAVPYSFGEENTTEYQSWNHNAPKTGTGGNTIGSGSGSGVADAEILRLQGEIKTAEETIKKNQEEIDRVKKSESYKKDPKNVDDDSTIFANKQDIETQKEKIKTAKAAIEARNDQLRKNAQAFNQGSGSGRAGSNAIDEDKSGMWCSGKYVENAVNCESTNLINKSIEMGNTMADKIGSATMGNKGAAETTKLAGQGSSATGDDYIKSQKRLLEENAKQNNMVGHINSAGALYQGVRAVQHADNAKRVRAAQEQRQGELLGKLDEVDVNIAKTNKDIETCSTGMLTTPPTCDQATLDGHKETLEGHKKQGMEYQERYKTAQSNADMEVTAHNNQVVVSSVAALTTAGQAGMHYMNAAGSRNIADSMKTGGGNKNQNPNANWTFNPPQMQPQDDGGDSNPPPVDTLAVVENDPGAGPLGGGALDDFNPGLGGGGAAGPPPGGFKPDDGNKGGGGGGPGLGGAGGTSASKDTGGEQKAEGGPGKGQTGGQYASGDGGSPKFSRSGGGGGGGGVGMNFGDLLKKLLPGDNEKKEERASLELDSDRSPASDKAAVIGRNKNIFQEISKRYQKKNNEGAVIFSDRT